MRGGRFTGNTDCAGPDAKQPGLCFLATGKRFVVQGSFWLAQAIDCEMNHQPIVNIALFIIFDPIRPRPDRGGSRLITAL
jgi:hypothetical protein